MLRLLFAILTLALAAPGLCQNGPPNGSLIPPGIRAIPTPDDSAIIIVPDLTNGTGQGLQWLGIGGAIACKADNSIVVWSGSDPGWTQPPPPVAPAPPRPLQVAPSQPETLFLWPEGVDDARPFDLNNSIIMGPRSAQVEAGRGQATLVGR